MLNFSWLAKLRIPSGKKRQRKSLLAFSERLEKRSMLTAFVVTSTGDAPDADPGDGLALTAAGETTIRSAIEEANANPGADTIEIPAGLFEIPASGPLSGDGIRISEDLQIRGAARDETRLFTAEQMDQAFDLDSGVTLLLDDLSLISRKSLTEGLQPGGGEIELEDVIQLELPAGLLNFELLDSVEIYLIDLAQHEFEAEFEADAEEAEDEETAFPIQSDEPLRTNARHAELLDGLSDQQQTSRPIQRPLIVRSLFELPDGLAPISKPDILRESRRQELIQQLDDSHSKPADLQLTKDESTEPDGDRTAKNERKAADDPTSRRENVINSLFEKKGDAASRQVQPASGEKRDPEATPAPARLPLSPVPLSEDGELLLKPARENSRPLPPPLPEPADDGSTSAVDVSVYPMAAAAMAVVPLDWKRRLRKRLRYWQAVVS
ncbi:MAG: hypothetical protein O2820_14800 [Planctomycetota bacterium]|nr:hypothetical protein [Planctomycetota bacterium]MDA1250484.1 hypothetical protein [Planctomycetota bacterium]